MVDRAGEDLAFAPLEVEVDVVALGLAHPLHDHLFGGLRRDAAEIGKVGERLDGPPEHGSRVDGAGRGEGDLGEDVRRAARRRFS